jgi:hypothetical protein
MQDTGYLNSCRYLLHDRDKKFGREFRETLAAGGVRCTPIPARSRRARGSEGAIRRRERLGGLLKYYSRAE